MDPKLLLLAVFLNYAEGGRKNDTCGCYILGTVSSIEGESLCDEATLQCSCLPNATGINCDRCAKNHYDIFSGRGCTSCNCNAKGAVSTQCDDDGVCQCKEGYEGSLCERCSYLKHKVDDVCVDCDCNRHGSENLQCDRNGRCSCRENYEGWKCDACKENTYNLKEGCKPCPHCYSKVQNASQHLKHDLETSDISLRLIEFNASAIIQDFENFLVELQILVDNVDKLHNVDLSVPVDVEELFVTIEQQVGTLEEDAAAALDKMKEFNAEDMDNSLKTLRNELQAANDLLAVAQQELDNAKTRSEQLGNHNNTMTELAKKAEALLETITKKAEELEQQAKDATAAIDDVCAAAEAFETQQKQIEADVEQLKSEVKQTADGAMTIKNYTEAFHAETKLTKDKANSLKKEADDIVVLDDTELSTGMAIIKFDAFIVEGLVDEINNATEAFENDIHSIEKYLDKVENRQNILETEFKLLQQLEKDADTAIDEIDTILTQAETDYQNLLELQAVYQQIQDAMKNISPIEEKIKAVQENAKDAMQIFVELLDIIQTNEEEFIKVLDIMAQVERNETIISARAQEVDDIFEEQEEAAASLVELHKDLKNLRYNVDKLKALEEDTENKIQAMREYILVLDAIPSDDVSLDAVEKEIETLEEMYRSVEVLNAEKELLKGEVDLIKQILESIPIDDWTLCEHPESEPKLGIVSAKE